jgi:hypothetical protein
MFNHLPKKFTLLIAGSLVFSSAALAGGLERESRTSSYTAAATSSSSAAATSASTSPASASAAAETLVTAPFNNTRGVWISRSMYRPSN